VEAAKGGNKKKGTATSLLPAAYNLPPTRIHQHESRRRTPSTQQYKTQLD
jgi:hypothetical protein